MIIEKFFYNVFWKIIKRKIRNKTKMLWFLYKSQNSSVRCAQGKGDFAKIPGGRDKRYFSVGLGEEKGLFFSVSVYKSIKNNSISFDWIKMNESCLLHLYFNMHNFFAYHQIKLNSKIIECTLWFLCFVVSTQKINNWVKCAFWKKLVLCKLWATRVCDAGLAIALQK